MSRLAGHLASLEAEAVQIFREAVAERERPVLLFSGGKDSIVLLRLAEKAFRPARFPFPLMHVDTGHNFDEVIAFRDARAKALGERLIVASVQDSIDRGRVAEDVGPLASRNRLQTTTLLDAIAEHRFDVAFGGARRDEDRARAKERVVSVRDAFGQWEPKTQRAEPWGQLNLSIKGGQSLRVFPISNFTELDIWEYIAAEKLEVPSIYYSHTRAVIERQGMLYAATGPNVPQAGERITHVEVRFRTIGDITCTGAVRSSARDIDEILRETATATITERGATRADDKFSEAAMEDRKREGYF
ncbi:MAG: sulfate adenylyltransferase subunit CysD [Polyangia bacterium]